MIVDNSRKYEFKDVELTTMCRINLFFLKRDHPDFLRFSPKYSMAYITGYEGEIEAAEELNDPRAEAAIRIAMTKALYETLDGLLDPVKWLEGYIKLAKSTIPISVANFGIPALRKAINAKDAEGAKDSLHLININIGLYKGILTLQGLSEELTTRFETDAAAIVDFNQKQMEIEAGRKALLHDNVGLFNTLRDKFAEILSVGKILYSKSDPVKLQEYTQSELIKKVRTVARPIAEDTTGSTPAEA